MYTRLEPNRVWNREIRRSGHKKKENRLGPNK